MRSSRVILFVASVTTLLVAVLCFNLWLILYRHPALEALIIVLAVETLLLAGLSWMGYAALHNRLIRPLRMLEDQLKVLTYTDAHHEMPLSNHHLLGSLPDTAEKLAHALLLERDQTARAIDSATAIIDRRTARLEAILHDLSEGIIVCSQQHLITLFNQAASLLLRDLGTLSLHREIHAFFKESEIEETFDRLLHLHRTKSEREVAEFECPIGDNVVHARMNLIIEPDSSCKGYVLSLSGDTIKDLRYAQSDQSVLNDRPEFYDFSLFDRDTSLEQLDVPLNELSFVVFDTETTGLRPSQGDEIVQISGVRVVGKRILSDGSFDELVNPGVSIPPASIRFHGITDDMVAGAASVSEVLKRFSEFADGSILVAHNAAFDMKFLKLKEEPSGVIFDHPVLDTLLLSFVMQPNHSAHTLDAIAARFGIEIPPEARHTALGDAQFTAEVFLRMLDTLPNQGIVTLRQAIDATNRVFEIRRMQERF
jgi:DNA polymerase-3 subunit epsilon